MEFGEILDEWEKIKRERAAERRASGGARGGASGAAPASGKKLGPGPRPGEAPKASPHDGEPAPRSLAKPIPQTATKALEAWLAAKGVHDKDAEQEEHGRASGARRAAAVKRLAAIKPQASIDLHGMGAEAAAAALSLFLADSAARGLEKVLVVHGKGIHSEGKPVLKALARRVIEASPWAGRFGTADRADGGTGALWVALRPKSGPATEDRGEFRY